jgi:hypothetical protein
MNGKRALGLAGLALAVWILGASGAAYGQGNTWVGDGLARMVEGARWRLGELRVNAAFTLDNTGYDSDIFFGYFGDDAVADWTFAAGVPVQILLPLSKKIVLDLSDTPQYLYYHQTARERAFNNTFRGQVHFALEALCPDGRETADVRRRFSPELDINVREKRDSLDGTFLWQASKAASIAILYERAQYDYGDAEYRHDLSEMAGRRSCRRDRVHPAEFGDTVHLDGQHGIYAFTGDHLASGR